MAQITILYVVVSNGYLRMIKIKSEKYGSPIFVEDDLSIVVLPSVFCCVLETNKNYFHLVKVPSERGMVKEFLEERDASDSTISIIFNRLETYLSWVEEYSRESRQISLNNHHNISANIINHFINEVLIGERGAGEAAVRQHIMALNAYYNYLAANGFTNLKKIILKPRFRERARENNKTRTAVKYLTPELRCILYQNTESIRDELLLKTGGELGLRSRENLGFLLDDFYVGGKRLPGMKALFSKLSSNPEVMEFEYFLQGRFVKSSRHKGGLPRVLYIHRDLLLRMKEYFDNERPTTEENTLFVNCSDNELGTPISKSRASRSFKDTRDKVLELQSLGMLDENGQLLEGDHTHHVLRHSFGTDKFYDLAASKGIRVDDVVPTSQVYLTVAALMGHNAADNAAPKSTKSYIRGCHIKEQYMVD